MEALDEISKNMSKSSGFFTHVFDFSDDSKDEMFNITQYAVLAILPVVILNKITQKIVPEADEDKSNIEILAEVVSQIIGMFLGILFIHRMITFIPTHSGVKYSNFSVTNNILAALVIILSLQTKLGEKVSILADRVIELWDGPSDAKQQSKKKTNVKVSQPISQNIQMSQSLGMNPNSNSTLISQLPIAPQITKPPQTQDYINMYRQDNTLGSSQHGGYPTSQMENEPVAANFGGGSAFGSSF
jgi:hypothetical protein